ncbi:hypothetical protein HMPREF9518_01031 [Enterococcus faecalis TX1342]|nr:hypothetical protein HMPREF9518_01031 [Enterococcus faecalis TX1342]
MFFNSIKFRNSQPRLKKAANKRKVPCQTLILQGIFDRKPYHFL